MVASTSTNWMLLLFRNRGWMAAVTPANTISTATMPNSRIRNTRSASRRELAGDGLPGSRAGGRRARGRGPAWPSSGLRLELAGRRRHDVLLGRFGLGELRGQPALAHDQNPVGQPPP